MNYKVKGLGKNNIGLLGGGLLHFSVIMSPYKSFPTFHLICRDVACVVSVQGIRLFSVKHCDIFGNPRI